jgi:hypothetical protein
LIFSLDIELFGVCVFKSINLKLYKTRKLMMNATSLANDEKLLRLFKLQEIVGVSADGLALRERGGFLRAIN